MTLIPLEQHSEPLPSPWTSVKPGNLIEVRRPHARIQRGIVEIVLADGSGLWIEPHGAEPRIFVDGTDQTVVLWG